MSIRIIGGRFVGLRVQRSIQGESRPRIKNFSLRIPIRRNSITTWRAATDAEVERINAKAVALDHQWELDQHAARVPRVFDPFDTTTNTGVKGITYSVKADSQNYMVEAFRLYVSHDGRPKSAIARLGRRTWSAGWTMIVARLVNIKNLNPDMHQKLLKSMPSERKLRARHKS